jgi:hypothetical protein
MVEELGDLIAAFPGEANRTRCFAHIINLIAKSVIKQFDVPKATAGDIWDDDVEELIGLAGEIELEELVTRASTNEDDENEDDNVEDWQDERFAMTEEVLQKLNDDVQPVRRVLVKVGLFEHILQMLSLLTPRLMAADRLSSASLPTPSKTRRPSSYQDGTRFSKDSSSAAASCLGMSLPDGTQCTTCFSLRLTIARLWKTSLVIAR